MSTSSSRALLALATAFALSAVGCNGEVAPPNDPTTEERSGSSLSEGSGGKDGSGEGEANKGESGTAQCAAYPSCPDGSVEVQACTPDSRCSVVELCGARILCEDTTGACDPAPACDAGDTEVANESACLQDDAVCYERVGGCDRDLRVWCTGGR